MNSKATLVGFTAVLMWGLLAYFSKLASDLPPFQLMAMGFGLGGLVGVASWPFRPGASQVMLSQRWQVWALNVGGLFGCHLVYFVAVRNGPVAEVSLIAYMWPLLIVVFSAFAPGERLRAHHLIGVILSIIGAYVVISKGQLNAISGGITLGHVIAVPYAFMWAAFSVSIRRFGEIPSDIVAGFCLACAALSGLCHFVFETTVWSMSVTQGVAILGLGLLPMGAAFYAWDFGMKRGDRIILGAASYAAPLISTLVLLMAGMTAYHWSIALACLLFTGGAVIAAKDMIFVQRLSQQQ